MAQVRILVVDDEPKYTYVIKANLQARGYTVLTATTGTEAIDLTAAHEPDLLILDLRLPDVDGFEVCRAVRTFSTLPILMLTALTDPVDRVKGLGCGADDYIPKPFDMDELIARVEAALRRIDYDRPPHPSGPLHVGALRIDPLGRQAYVDGQPLQITPVEFKLLCELVRHRDQVLLHAYLLAQVWGEGYAGDEPLLHQAVSRLRRKIASLPDPPIRIDTHYGVGYICHPAPPPLEGEGAGG